MVSTKPSDSKQPLKDKREGIVLNERGEEVPADKATAQRTKESPQPPDVQPMSPGQPAGGE